MRGSICIAILAGLSIFLLLSFAYWPRSATKHHHSEFLKCLLSQPNITPSISQLVYTPHNTTYRSVVDAYVQNPRFLAFKPRPVAVVAPISEDHIKATLACSVKLGLQLRVRSAGHDFEGMSFLSRQPFVIMDLFNYRSIIVDIPSHSAWVETGATLGEVYYTITQAKGTFGYPAGYWSTVGSGGHISGGGYGPLLRAYGLAADNVLDAKFMDVNGRILYRETMGEDLFWALRGGGGGNFGIVLAWKINLVEVPEIATLCKLNRISEQGVTELIHKWQSVAHIMPKELVLEINIKSLESTTKLGERTINARFEGTYLGRLDDLLSLMESRFPELGLTKEDCSENSWIDTLLKLSPFPAGTSPEILLNRTYPPRPYAKQKADYVEEPIPIEGLEGLWEVLHQMDPGMGEMNWTPYGGMLDEIPATATPYPHRSGVLYMIYEAVYWTADTEDVGAPPRQMQWIRELYDYLAPYVSKDPRRAYANYRDFDLGVDNINGETSYEEAASAWGIKYFVNNFERLARVKGAVDPDNYFRNGQSIPPLSPLKNGQSIPHVSPRREEL